MANLTRPAEVLTAPVASPAPPKWVTFSADGPPLAAIRSRAWHEWAQQRPRRSLLPETRQAVIDRDGLICGLCGGDVEPDDIHIDHITPFSMGGTHDLENLHVTHSACNMRKGNRV